MLPGAVPGYSRPYYWSLEVRVDDICSSMTPEELFDQICDKITGAKRSAMFGAPCLKTPNGKAAVCLSKGYMVFKLDKATEKEVLSLSGAGPFDPMGGRPMGGWTQLGFEHKDRWLELSKKAIDFVAKLEAKPAKAKKK